MKSALLRGWGKGNGRHFIALVVAGVVLVNGGVAVADPLPGLLQLRAPTPKDNGPASRAARPRSSTEHPGLLPNTENRRTGLLTVSESGGEEVPMGFHGGDKLVGDVVFSAPGEYTQELEQGDSEVSYTKAYEKTFNTPGFLALASTKLIDPAAGDAIWGAITHGLTFKHDRTQNGRGQTPKGGMTPYQAEVQRALHNCIMKKMEAENLAEPQASDLCQKDQLFALSDHPQAHQNSPGGGANDTELRLSTLLFEVDQERVEQTTLPDGNLDAANIVTEFKLTADEFRQKFGDVAIKGEVVNNRVKQSVKILSPWEASGVDPSEVKAALSNTALLDDQCAKPVTLDFARYCWAYHFYNTIMWTVKAQCRYFNDSARLPTSHQPMSSAGNGLGSFFSLLDGGGTEDQPGPWGVNRKDWERVATDLSFPGYTFGVKTAEAFFYSYRRGVPRLPNGVSIDSLFGSFGSILSSLIGGTVTPTDPELQIDCSGVDRERAAFTFVAQNFNRIRFPTWISAAARFANARALLFSRDIVVSAWAVIQQYTSSLGYQDLAESARRLLTSAYDSSQEAMVQEELKKVAKILEKLELEYEMAKTARGGKANTSAR